MTEKLTIIVTCTDRKSLPVIDDLRVRNLPPGPVEQRVDIWAARLAEAHPQRPLRALYQGETWTQVLRLEHTARQAGFEPRLLVASAGLGLRSVEQTVPSYGATFSSGSPDVVGTALHHAQDWWHLLQEMGSPDLDGPMMWVLSKSYADVVADDLLARAATPPTLVFGGSDRMPAEGRVSSNRSLRRALGGTATSLNVRMAIQWLELAAGTGLASGATRQRWEEWSAGAETADRYDRTPMTDADIIDFIHALRRADHSLTKSRALRQLRDAGHACEQRRFGALFTDAGVSR